jgi:hypothetical protein
MRLRFALETLEKDEEQQRGAERELLLPSREGSSAAPALP